jgi:Mn2+/Fe2+ NRAMP family transporter
MGRFANGRVFNILAWITAAALILLAGILIVVTFLPR